MSTLIIIHNNTDIEIGFDKASYEAAEPYGRWERDPKNIPAGKYMACLHVHRTGAAVGSAGTIKL